MQFKKCMFNEHNLSILFFSNLREVQSFLHFGVKKRNCLNTTWNYQCDKSGAMFNKGSRFLLKFDPCKNFQRDATNQVHMCVLK